MRSGGAGDLQVSARGLLKVVEGERDADVGKLLSVDGVLLGDFEGVLHDAVFIFRPR
jgi:hypothetical protein